MWKKIDRADGDGGEVAADGEGQGRARFFARGFVVFNRDQVEGVDGQEIKEVEPATTEIAEALSFLESVGIPVEYGLYDAHYRADLDRVYLPNRSAFDSDLDLIGTFAHEVCHGVGHSSRLARETLRDYHKDRAIRAREEILVELAASFLMADLGLAYTPRPDHAAYCASWLSLLKHDHKAIFTAAAGAQAAADWIHAHAGTVTAPLALAA